MAIIAFICIKDSVKWVQQNNGKCLIQRTAKKKLKKNGSKLLKLFLSKSYHIFQSHNADIRPCSWFWLWGRFLGETHTSVSCWLQRMTSHLRASHLENSQEHQGKTGRDGDGERKKTGRRRKTLQPVISHTGHTPLPFCRNSGIAQQDNYFQRGQKEEPER